MFKEDEEQKEAQVAAWDAAADNEIYSKKVYWNEDPFLRQLEAEIPFNSKMRVLDIGCGSGRYSLALAEKVEEVVGIDISPKMIENARKIAEKARVKNIQYYVGDFSLMDRSEFPGQFDVIIAHMTPAIMKMEDFSSMRNLAEKEETFFFLVKAIRREGQIEDTIIKRLGIEGDNRKLDNMVLQMFTQLWEEGITPTIKHRLDWWVSQKTVDDAMEWIFNKLVAYKGVERAKREEVYSYLKEIAIDNRIDEKVEVLITTLGWKEIKKGKINEL